MVNSGRLLFYLLLSQRVGMKDSHPRDSLELPLQVEPTFIGIPLSEVGVSLRHV